MTEATKQTTYDEINTLVEGITKNRKFPNFYQLCTELEIALITAAMKRTGGNCQKASELLGLNRTTLVEKRRRYKMHIHEASNS